MVSWAKEHFRGRLLRSWASESWQQLFPQCDTAGAASLCNRCFFLCSPFTLGGKIFYWSECSSLDLMKGNVRIGYVVKLYLSLFQGKWHSSLCCLFDNFSLYVDQGMNHYESCAFSCGCPWLCHDAMHSCWMSWWIFAGFGFLFPFPTFSWRGCRRVREIVKSSNLWRFVADRSFIYHATG